jgi:hypothetical protein
LDIRGGEQNHYYNPVLGYPVANFGLANGDPATAAFQSATTLPGASPAQQASAQQLYAILAGRLSGVGGNYAFSPSADTYAPAIGRYNLDELESASGLFLSHKATFNH